MSYGMKRIVVRTKGESISGCGKANVFRAFAVTKSYGDTNCPKAATQGYVNNHSGSDYVTYDCTKAYCQWGTDDGVLRFFRFTYGTSSYTDYAAVFRWTKTTTTEETSYSEVTSGGQISNVQKWVKYRAK